MDLKIISKFHPHMFLYICMFLQLHNTKTFSNQNHQHSANCFSMKGKVAPVLN